MARISKPTVAIRSEVENYYRYYVVSVKPFQAMRPYIAKFDSINDLIVFCEIMRAGIYGATIGTGSINDDLKIESELRFANIKVIDNIR